MAIEIKIIPYADVTSELKATIDSFGKENFDTSEAIDPGMQEQFQEWYFANPTHYFLAYEKGLLVGSAILQFREISFEGHAYKMAGFGGLTVSKKHRRMGIGSKLLEERIRFSLEQNADVGFLNTDINAVGHIFSRFGFVPLGRNYSFIGKSGALHEDDSGMICSLRNCELFDAIREREEPFFIGESNI